MEVVDLGKLHGSYQKQTTLDMAQDLQTGLLSVAKDSTTALGYEAISMMGDPETLDGLRKIYIHAIGSLVVTEGFIRDDVELENGIGHSKYIGDFYLRGNFSKFAYVEFQSLQSICLRILQPELINADVIETDIDLKKLSKSCAYIPVHAVETVLAA